MRWKMKFLTAVTMLVVGLAVSPSYSQDNPPKIPILGDIPILAVVSLGQGEQGELGFILRPVIFADGSATSLSAERLTITLHKVSPNTDGARCSQNFNLTDEWTRGINHLNVRPLGDRVVIDPIEEELDPCFYGWTRIVVIVSGPRVFRFEEGTDDGAAGGAAQIIPLLLSVIDENGQTRGDGRVYTVQIHQSGF